MHNLSTSLVIGTAIKPSLRGRQKPPTSAQIHHDILKENPNMRGRNMLTTKMSEKKHFLFAKRAGMNSANMKNASQLNDGSKFRPESKLGNTARQGRGSLDKESSTKVFSEKMSQAKY